jgi:hypothetical protein
VRAQEAADSNEALAFEECCSGTEPTVYAAIALVTAGLSCLCCCVGAAADDNDTKWLIVIMFGPLVVPLLLVNGGFWIGCTPASRGHTV